MKRIIQTLLMLAPLSLAGQSRPDTAIAALKDRAMSDQISRMKTDERIRMFEALAGYKSDNPHYKNLLATAFLQKTRETTDFSYLDRAAQIIDGVLAADANNYEALRIRGVIELERHNFASVAELSRRMIALAPQDAFNYGTLGDALMELGQYDQAAEAYQKMVTLRPDLSSYNRAAYFRFVAGDASGAIEIMQKAIEAGSGQAENLAWCLTEFGNLLYKTGQTAAAERAFAAAVKTFPGFHPAHAGLGLAAAALGRTADAIASYRKAQAIVPMIEYASALQALYADSGRAIEASQQMALIDAADKLGRAAKENLNRSLAMAYADQDRNLARSLELARAEYAVRKDIYTADALAWALYKNQRYEEARKLSSEALRMGTPEPVFYFHAGMIAKASGDDASARKHLDKALALNPKFDARQAAMAAKLVAEKKS